MEPARGNSRSGPRTTTRGQMLLRPRQGGPSQFRTLGAGPDVLLRQQRPYGSTLTGRVRPLSSLRPPLFAPPLPRPLPRGAGSQSPGEDPAGRSRVIEKRKAGDAGGRGTGRLAQFYSFQKRRNPKEEKIYKEEVNELTNLAPHPLIQTLKSC